MNFLRNEEISLDSWQNLLANSGYSSPFQTPEFYKSVCSLKYPECELCAVESDGELQSLILVVLYREKGLKSFFSRRGIVYGGPIVRKESQNIEFLLTSMIKSIGRGVIYYEIRNYFDYSNFNTEYSKSGWKFVNHLNIQLLLKNKSVEDILSGMKYNRRREIKLSLKEGVTYEECKSRDDLKKVYTILKELYKKKVKLPLPEFGFFLSLFTNNVVKTFVVKHNDQVIGGSICPYLKRHSIYTYYYCGLRDYHKKIYPTHIAILAAIDYAIKNEISILDFMGAGIPGQEYGVRSYKSQFGGSTINQGRYLKVVNPLLYFIGRFGISLLSKIRK